MYSRLMWPVPLSSHSPSSESLYTCTCHTRVLFVCVFVRVCTCAYLFTHACHTCVCVRAFKCACGCVQACVHLCTCVRLYACVHACTCSCVHVCVLSCVCACACVCMRVHECARVCQGKSDGAAARVVCMCVCGAPHLHTRCGQCGHGHPPCTTASHPLHTQVCVHTHSSGVVWCVLQPPMFVCLTLFAVLFAKLLTPTLHFSSVFGLVCPCLC